MSGMLYIVATPIGNLKDITFRAIETLKSVDFVLAEDTRVTANLFKAYEVKTPLKAFHQHSKNTQWIVEELMAGKNVALVSDAGTPGLNDPGGKLIEDVLKNSEVRVVPIPGVSALTAIISVAGIPMESFEYKGFIPHKKGRQTFFKDIAMRETPVIFFESTHRILKALEQLNEFAPDKQLIVGRELTKIHETVYRGNPTEVIDQLNQTSIKGEFVIIAY